jgi:hypothetical protein
MPMISLPIQDLFDLLKKAVTEGMAVEKAGTKGDFTESGIAYHVFKEYMDTHNVDIHAGTPTGPVYRPGIGSGSRIIKDNPQA